MKQQLHPWLSIALVACMIVPSVQADGPWEIPFSQIPFPHLVPPSAYGVVVDAYRAGTEEQPRIILIQDMHGHVGAQRNIAQVLYHLVPKLSRAANHPIPLYVEGAWTSVDPSPIRNIPEAKLREITANYLLNKTEFTGSDYFAVMHPEFANLFEIRRAEERDLYLTQMEVLQRSLPNHQALVKRIQLAESSLHGLRNQNYPLALRRLYKLRQAYQNGKIDPARYAASLITLARIHHINLQPYRFMHQALASGKIPEASAELVILNREFSHLHYALAHTLVQQKPLWAYLPFDDFHTQVLLNNMVIIDQYLDLLKQLVSEPLPREDTGAAYRLLPQLAQVAQRLMGADTATPELSEVLRASLDFYPLSVLRDDPLIRNTLVGAQEGPAILVAGGFHAQGMVNTLRKQGVSYLIIAPVIDRPMTSDEQMNYVKRTAGDYLTADEVERDFVQPATQNQEPIRPPS